METYRYTQDLGEQLYQECVAYCRYCKETIQDNELCGCRTEGLCDGGLICTECLIERHPYIAAKGLFGLEIDLSVTKEDTTTAKEGDIFLEIKVKQD